MSETNNNPAASASVLTHDGAAGKTMTGSVAVLRFIALLSVALLAPALGVQALTGTLVNATLFIAAVLLGVPGAILIGIIPSAVSAMTGLLPAAILPMVPFIILSNVLLIVTFSALRRKSYWTGVALASAIKFVFLSGVSSLVIGYFVPEKIADKIALMMSYPQLFTALSGGILAYFVLGIIKKVEKK